MSLIADALKAAQKEKTRRTSPQRTTQETYFPFRIPERASGGPFFSPLVIGAGVAAAAIALTVLVFVFSPSRRPETRPPAVAQFPDSAAATLVLETPGITADSALPDTAADEPSERIDPDEYVEDPPPQRTSMRPAPRAAPPQRTTGDAATPAGVLPSISGAAVPRTGGETGGRLQITVDRPITSGGAAGGGLFEQGLAAQRRGDFETAKNRYLQATYENPRNPDIWNNLGTAYLALGDVSGAEAAFRQATEVNARFPAAWSNLGIVLVRQGRGSEAIIALQEAVRLDPANGGAKVNLAIQLHEAGAPADARKLLEDALRADPALAEAHYELGRVLEKQNDRAGAAREYRLFLSTAGSRFSQLQQLVRGRLAALSP
ncbi:MAG: tetratricopeptide repeat protein [Gemmatimonadaceae bacterium]|nr:tetratricopeptide repeat protein [Gemmatimonadaceae bacterium]